MLEPINLTPHPVVIVDAAGEGHTIPPSGAVARFVPGAGATTRPCMTLLIGGNPVVVRVGKDETEGLVVGLPDPVEGVVYIVSGMVLAEISGAGRTDVVAPGTGPLDRACRNAAGHIVGVTMLKVTV